MVSRASLSGINVLVASDERELQIHYRGVLTSAGASVTVTDSAENALVLAAQLGPDVVVAALKERRAVELLFRMRAVAGLSEVPIMAVVARDAPVTMTDGFDDVVEHPFDPPELVARVARVVRRRQGQ
jgi:two-component system alkaline phosphatase synthesis response regulator PhoP